MADILFTIKAKRVVVTGVTPKGTEWILLNCTVDEPCIEEKQIPSLRWQMEQEGLDVELFFL